MRDAEMAADRERATQCGPSISFNILLYSVLVMHIIDNCQIGKVDAAYLSPVPIRVWTGYIVW